MRMPDTSRVANQKAERGNAGAQNEAGHEVLLLSCFSVNTFKRVMACCQPNRSR